MALAVCVECGGTVSTEADACPHCGCPVDSDPKSCPECGKPVMPRAYRCPGCGFKVRLTEAEENAAHHQSRERMSLAGQGLMYLFWFAVFLVLVAVFLGPRLLGK